MALSERLGPLDIPGKQTPPENRHITLRFVGDLDEVGLDRWMANLDMTPLGGGFRMGLGSLGAFPGPGKATVVWVGIDTGSEPLERLASVVEDSAVSAGLGREERPFRPHLTLSRVRPPRDVRSLTEVSFTDLVWKVDEVVLLESHLGGGPARYERLAGFSLDG